MKKLTSLFALAAIAAALSFSAPAKVDAAPAPVAMCYYGLTIHVPASYVPRYQSIGATLGPCATDK